MGNNSAHRLLCFELPTPDRFRFIHQKEQTL
nr:MAG TPA: hypothetical protein [Caudoviricetes sp.]